mmetsp:Transcript_112883/g.258497  ORF Transcript_112883/g.258497 Transcript_112883/m.258497 type:complete len:243 (-) Transcript_112883:628-1356(-)
MLCDALRTTSRLAPGACSTTVSRYSTARISNLPWKEVTPPPLSATLTRAWASCRTPDSGVASSTGCSAGASSTATPREARRRWTTPGSSATLLQKLTHCSAMISSAGTSGRRSSSVRHVSAASQTRWRAVLLRRALHPPFCFGASHNQGHTCVRSTSARVHSAPRAPGTRSVGGSVRITSVRWWRAASADSSAPTAAGLPDTMSAQHGGVCRSTPINRVKYGVPSNKSTAATWGQSTTSTLW